MSYLSQAELEADGIDFVEIQRVASVYLAYGYGEYADDSVLSGQPRRLYLGSFPAASDALEAFPFGHIQE